MRLAVRDVTMPQSPGLAGVVTFSAGVATAVPGQTSRDFHALIQIAEAALYPAKAAGRDNVQARSSGSAFIRAFRARHLPANA
jgi:PleD family two-component response regulator